VKDKFNPYYPQLKQIVSQAQEAYQKWEYVKEEARGQIYELLSDNDPWFDELGIKDSVLEDKAEKWYKKTTRCMYCNYKTVRLNKTLNGVEIEPRLCGNYRLCENCRKIKAVDCETPELLRLQLYSENELMITRIPYGKTWEAFRKRISRADAKYRAYPQPDYKLVVNTLEGDEVHHFSHLETENDNELVLDDILENVPEGKRITTNFKTPKSEKETDVTVVPIIIPHIVFEHFTQQDLAKSMKEIFANTEVKACTTVNELRYQFETISQLLIKSMEEKGFKILATFSHPVLFSNEDLQEFGMSILDVQLQEELNTAKTDRDGFEDWLVAENHKSWSKNQLIPV